MNKLTLLATTLSLLFFTSCGSEPILEAGVYDIALIYIEDPDMEPGDFAAPLWYIAHPSEGKYNLKVYGAGTDVNGKEKNGKVVFKKVSGDLIGDCRVVLDFEVNLAPITTSGFLGMGNIQVHWRDKDPESFCPMDSWVTRAEVRGVKQ